MSLVKMLNDEYLLLAFNKVAETHIIDDSFIKVLVFLLYCHTNIPYRKLAKIIINTSKKKDKNKTSITFAYVSFQKHASNVNEIADEITNEYNKIGKKLNKNWEPIDKNNLLLYLIYTNYPELIEKIKEPIYDVYDIDIENLKYNDE